MLSLYFTAGRDLQVGYLALPFQGLPPIPAHQICSSLQHLRHTFPCRGPHMHDSGHQLIILCLIPKAPSNSRIQYPIPVLIALVS